MQRYIEQLIEDIHEATGNIRPPHELWEKSGADPDCEPELEDMSYVEQYLYGEKEPIAQITGISQEQLPPPGKLTRKQQTLLATELEKLLQYFHFYLDFPKNYPVHLRYPFILNLWEEEYVPLSFGENHIEFCDYDEEFCPFPGYCTLCSEVQAQMKYEEEHGCTDGLDINVKDFLPVPGQIEAGEDQMKNSDPDNDMSSFLLEINENDDINSEDINGFYDDDGNKIEPHSVPVPGLCTICRKYQNGDEGEDLLCLMNRYDQRNETDFRCGAFDKK
jgi:hypothetical protein